MTQATDLDPIALTHHLETRYHAHHREQLPPLIELAAKVESVHAGAAGVPVGLAERLRVLMHELDHHMQKEELILFPAIRAGGGQGLEYPIAAMREDHADHLGSIAELQAMTNHATAPADACRSWTALYAGVREFWEDLAEHIRLENEVLFPQYEPAAPHAGCGCGHHA